MKRKLELLAPGGDIDSIKAAILAGADAVYCGLDKFNARNRAANINFEDLQGILRLAHKNSCQVFLTLNIIFIEREIPALLAILNKLVNTTIDGVIVQDPGLFYLLSTYFKSLKVHASTQLTTHNEGQIRFLNKLNAARVNLSRELNIDEITALTTVAHQHNILTEVFVHGSYCISFSGVCYMSSVHGGNSGNRGRCSQPCRDRYLTTAAGKDYPLNLKDNSAFFDLKDLDEAGVDSLKIEGRIKKSDYVYTVVNNWRKQLNSYYNQHEIQIDNNDLYKVFNRDFSNGFLKGNIHKNLFIDNPRDHTIQHLSEVNTYESSVLLESAHLELYAAKEEKKTALDNKLSQITIAKEPLTIHISGVQGARLKVTVISAENSFDVLSAIHLESKGTEALTYQTLFARLKAINNTGYFIEQISIEDLCDNVYLPFKELTSIKKRILLRLNNSKTVIDPVDLPILKKSLDLAIKPSLSVLISSPNDLSLCDETSAEIFFQLPGCLKDDCPGMITLFKQNKRLIPWFSSIIIGEDYNAAIEFLHQVQPECIVTNNTGIAFEADRLGISWIAGPLLNIVNSYSLLCLKENFNCAGSFISNEINKNQIQAIKKPENFKLYYSIFHQIVLMTSRQCLFYQVTGCEKNKIDDSCLQRCERSSSITNLKNGTFLIHKTKGNYHTIFNEIHFLNPDITEDLKDHFSCFLIDLRDIQTHTEIGADKSGLIKLFENLLQGDQIAKEKIMQMVHPVTNTQYIKGI